MLRYFFDLRDENGVSTDDEGTLFPSLEAVQNETARTLGDFARDEAQRVKLDTEHKHRFVVEVRNETGMVLEAAISFEIKRLH